MELWTQQVGVTWWLGFFLVKSLLDVSEAKSNRLGVFLHLNLGVYYVETADRGSFSWPLATQSLIPHPLPHFLVL